MTLFLAMLAKLFPLYATMGSGFLLSRAFGNMSKTLAQIQIYLISPVIVLTNMMKLDYSADLLMMPLILGTLCLSISFVTNYVANKAGSDYAPLLAQASGAANLGYLGIPVAAILFPDHFIPVYILTLVGGLIYESSVGYYWIARGKYTPLDAVKSLFRIPLIYALALGLFLNALGLVIPQMWEGVVRDFMGAYIVLGALIVGLGLAQNKKLTLNFKVLGTMLGIKFLVWPVAVIALLALLRLTPFAPPAQYEPIFMLMSVLPLAANTAALASLLNVHPDEAATAVALSTVLSLAIIPAYVLFFGLSHG
ncbi:MAG: AEC family transporter [Alphaproteobacteria bacterium]|nr:AEC family transporter [Alphaproteobacteria bacterium]